MNIYKFGMKLVGERRIVKSVTPKLIVTRTVGK